MSYNYLVLMLSLCFSFFVLPMEKDPVSSLEELAASSDSEFEEFGYSEPVHEYKQLKVVDQFESSTYGGTSGYHALKNGLIIARMLLASEDQKPFIQALLTDINLVNQLFGSKQSPWLAYILWNRGRALAGCYLLHTLHQYWSFPSESPEFIKDVLKKITAKMGIRDGYKWHYVIQKQDILKIIEKYWPLKFSSFYADYGSKQSDFTLNFSVLDDLTVVDENQKIVCKRIIPFKELKDIPIMPGEWITKHDIEYLYLFEKERHKSQLIQGLFDKKDLFEEIVAICDPSVYSLTKQFEENPKLKKLTGLMRSPLTSFVAALIIEQPEFPHWFTCVIKKQKNHVLYVLADSANVARLKDPHLQNIVTLLQGKNVTEFSKSESLPNFLASSFQICTQSSDKSESATKDTDITSDSPSKNQDNSSIILSNKTVKDLIGIPQEITRVIQVLNNPQPRIPCSSMLLYGPPGTGKTTVCEVIANATKRKLFILHASKAVDQYQGSGAQAIHSLFAQAEKENKPVVVCIDEIDHLTATGSSIAQSQTYEGARLALMAELDKKDRNILVIATTNHLEKIDPTIKSRLDSYIIKIDLPDKENRRKIFKLYAHKHKVTIGEVLLNQLTEHTEGLSGRVIEEIIKKAIKLAEARDSQNFRVTDFDWYSALYSNDERLPSQHLREVMLHHFAKVHGVDCFKKEDYKSFAQEAAGLSGNKLEEVVQKARDISDTYCGPRLINEDCFYLAIHSMNPKKLPSRPIRIVLLKYYLKEKLAAQPSQATISALATRTEGFTANQLQAVVDRLVKITELKEGKEPSKEDAITAAYSQQKSRQFCNIEDAVTIALHYLNGKTYECSTTFIRSLLENILPLTYTQIKQVMLHAHRIANETNDGKMNWNDFLVARLALFYDPKEFITPIEFEAYIRVYSRTIGTNFQMEGFPDWLAHNSVEKVHSYSTSSRLRVQGKQLERIMQKAHGYAQQRGTSLIEEDFFQALESEKIDFKRPTCTIL